MNKIKKWLNQQEDGSFCIMSSNVNDDCHYSFILSKNEHDVNLGLQKNNETTTIIVSGIDEVAYEINNLFTLQDTLKIENKEVRYNIFDRELLNIVKSIPVVIEMNRIVHSVPNHQGRIFSLFEKYDTESYYKNRKGYYNPDRRQEIINEYYGIEDPEYRGLTNDVYDEDDDYVTMDDYRYDAWSIDILIMQNIAVRHDTRLHSIIGKI